MNKKEEKWRKKEKGEKVVEVGEGEGLTERQTIGVTESERTRTRRRKRTKKNEKTQQEELDSRTTI